VAAAASKGSGAGSEQGRQGAIKGGDDGVGATPNSLLDKAGRGDAGFARWSCNGP